AGMQSPRPSAQLRRERQPLEPETDVPDAAALSVASGLEPLELVAGAQRADRRMKKRRQRSGTESRRDRHDVDADRLDRFELALEERGADRQRRRNPIHR